MTHHAGSMHVDHASPIPALGQIAAVRQRRYVVTGVAPSALPDKLAQLPSRPQHLVTLNCIEDDGLGESLQVVWELEPGARVEEKVGLPALTGFDPPHRYDAFLNAVKWGAVSSADDRMLQAPFRSGIEIEDYQLDPLVRAVQMPRVNLLIADDVGLGKTIEAGLIAQELLVRNRARTVLVVCPAGLQVQWRDQMRDKFGLEFRIIDSQSLRELRRTRGIHVNPWTHFPRLITSIDFLKRDRPMWLMSEALPKGEAAYPRKFDLLILDEAHNVAPAGRGKYAIDSQRTSAIRMLAPHFEHKLFLSATPHNGYKESFSALLELLDDQRFARDVEPNPVQLQAVMVRRLKSELKDFDGKPRFPQRRLEALEVDYSAEERQAHDWLRRYAELRLQNAADATERYAAEFVLKLLKKRLFSSPAAFATTLKQHITTLGSKTGSAARPSAPVLQMELDAADEDYADDIEYEESVQSVTASASALLGTLVAEERDLLDKLSAWADRNAGREDSKAAKLVEWLHTHIKPNGEWTDERVIIFTEYRATQKWLQGVLAARGLASKERLMVLYGGLDTDEREQIKAAFQANPKDSAVRILLATDAASEGIDLQNHCHRLIHCEIPWNPNRLEQRNGRIDRHGQRHDPLVYHFVSKGYQKRGAEDVPAGALEADLEFLMRAVQKVEQIREDLGKVGPVIAMQVEEAMLGRRRRLETAYAERENESVRRLLKFERDLRRQIASHMEQLRETQSGLDLSPAHVQAVVETALAMDGQPALIPYGKIPGALVLPALHGSWATCVEGLPHPHTGAMRPIVFDHELAKGRDDVVLAHLNHKLVQKALRLLRATIWSPTPGLHRFTVRIVPNKALAEPAVIAHARLVVVGGNAHRLNEEVIFAGGTLREGRFRRMNVTDARAALEAATDEAPSAAMQQRLHDLWPAVQNAVMQSLDARMKDRLEGMKSLLDQRAHSERTNMHIIMGELERAIRAELDTPESAQMTLEFDDIELDQRRVNRDALTRRLAQIPGELAREQAAITARYADPQPRMFPVGVTFLVPASLARTT